MKSLLLSLIAVALAIGNASAYSDYVYTDQPLIQTTFDRLIPTSYPTIQPDFNKLRPTTWPLIYPGIPQIHIIDNLIHPVDQPLLIVN
jgi:hypothetical protein